MANFALDVSFMNTMREPFNYSHKATQAIRTLGFNGMYYEKEMSVNMAFTDI